MCLFSHLHLPDDPPPGICPSVLLAPGPKVPQSFLSVLTSWSWLVVRSLGSSSADPPGLLSQELLVLCLLALLSLVSDSSRSSPLCSLYLLYGNPFSGLDHPDRLIGLGPQTTCKKPLKEVQQRTATQGRDLLVFCLLILN